ncbi:hypothetical protein XELAEV_18042141mg [Xenopus laevis]|uniref:Uncharacterized protein n=1 Tax=Xenopus laevis TaxID=8355 RepID=A0A974C3M8_XENLA|nr:hypothetical protein XELAEV_18042141mg [Xenopus laevis]
MMRRARSWMLSADDSTAHPKTECIWVYAYWEYHVAFAVSGKINGDIRVTDADSKRGALCSVLQAGLRQTLLAQYSLCVCLCLVMCVCARCMAESKRDREGEREEGGACISLTAASAH